MRPTRTISRRSFLSRVAGASVLTLAGCATPRETEPYDPLEDAAPNERGGLARGSENAGREGCTDGDTGRHVDRPGHGRCTVRSPERRRRGL